MVLLNLNSIIICKVKTKLAILNKFPENVFFFLTGKTHNKLCYYKTDIIKCIYLKKTVSMCVHL